MTPKDYMTLALQLAEKGRMSVSPNPMVGCVIVKNNKIIATGWHQRAGESHAEIIALQATQEDLSGATLYVTLEPCCHYGRTPPCVDAILNSGIKEIYVACLDPNPVVAGKGIELLKQANITVHVGLLENEAKKLNEIFFHYITTKRPFVIAKWAMSLDGKTVTNPNDSRQISGEQAYQYTHQLRHQVDAILVGAKTALHDNPQLTARLHANEKQPIRIVLANKSELPKNLELLNNSLPGKTIIVTNNKMISAEQVEVLYIDSNNQSQISLPSLLEELGKRGITSLLIEGGMTTLNYFIKENLINKFHVYLTPTIISSLPAKKKLNNFSYHALGDDILISGEI